MRTGRQTLAAAFVLSAVAVSGCTTSETPSDALADSNTSIPADAGQTTTTEFVDIVDRSATLDLNFGECYTNIATPHPIPTTPIDAASGDPTTSTPLSTTTTLAVPPPVLLVSCKASYDGQVYGKFCLGAASPAVTTTESLPESTDLSESTDPADPAETGDSTSSIADDTAADDRADGTADDTAADLQGDEGGDQGQAEIGPNGEIIGGTGEVDGTGTTTTTAGPPTSLRPNDLIREVCPGNLDVPWPGNRTIVRAAARSCIEEFETVFGVDYSDSPRRSMEFVPNEALWAQGDRRVVCSIDEPPKEETTTTNG